MKILTRLLYFIILIWQIFAPDLFFQYQNPRQPWVNRARRFILPIKTSKGNLQRNRHMILDWKFVFNETMLPVLIYGSHMRESTGGGNPTLLNGHVRRNFFHHKIKAFAAGIEFWYPGYWVVVLFLKIQSVRLQLRQSSSVACLLYTSPFYFIIITPY